MSLNVVTILGHMGKDPELKYLPSGKAVCEISVATNDGWGDSKVTNWHKVVLWDKKAEICKEYCKKGSRVSVVGRVNYRSYEGKDGKKVYVTEIIATAFGLEDSKQDRDDSKADKLPDNPDTAANTDDQLPF